MTAKLLVLALLSVTLSAIAQIVLKAGVSGLPLAATFDGGRYVAPMIGALLNPYVIAGLALYVVGALVWLIVLSGVDVSLAYPFVGLGFLITMGFAALFLGEQISALRLLGTVMVAAGVWCVAYG